MKISIRIYVQICISVPKKLRAIETAKFKKEREEKQKEINSIQKEINEVFIEAIQELREQYPKLTQEDLFYCILQYLRLSTSTIKFCMRVESNQVLIYISTHKYVQIFSLKVL